MITMLWKELRENAKWGALALLGLLMAEFYALNQQQFFGFFVQESAPLCKSSFLMISTFGCAAVGLVIGLVQLLPEQRRDQWAALIHRPVERATIFRGKAVAGLLIYLVATIVPFAACVWYASRPGHFAAPFTPRMIFPGMADICAGAMYYFAALFVSLQRGAWWGTRAFGVLAALSGSFVVTSFNLPFYVVVEAAVTMSLALFAAAWGTMLTNGTFAPRPWLARFAALAVIFYGVVAAGAIAGMIWNAFQKPQYYMGSEYVVDVDGRPLVENTGKDGARIFHDLDGNLIHDPRLTGGQSYRNMIQMSEICSFVGKPHRLSLTQNLHRGYRIGDSYATMLQVFNQVNNEAWYFLVHEQIFQGFNGVSHAPVGSIGANGFVPGTARAESFPDRLGAMPSYQLGTVYRFGDTVYFLDVGERTLRPILTATGISGVANVSPYGEDPVLRDLAAVTLPDRCVLVGKDGRLFAALPYDHDMDRWGRMNMGVSSAKGPLFLEYLPSGWIPYEQQRTMPSYLEQFDLQGRLVKSYTLPPLPQFHFDRTWHQWIIEGLGTPAFFYGGMIYEKIGATFGSHRLAEQLHARFHQGWGYTKDVGTRITLLSLALAVVAFIWASRSEFPRREAWRWALFVLAFNVAGLITFRLAADWPVRVKCPSCGRKRRVDEATCIHCGAAWPLPPRDGTEIIDEPAQTATV